MFEIHFTVDGHAVSEAQIHQVELSRYHHVFKLLNQKGVTATLKGQDQRLDQLLALPLADAKDALAETKEAIGKPGMLELLKPELDQADQRWTDYAQHSAGQPLRAAYVEAETKGIDLYQFMLFSQQMLKENSLSFASKLHPEHYYFDADRSGRQVIVETFGMYKDPAYLDLRPSQADTYPVAPDAGVDLVMAGKTYLANSGLDTQLMAMHQLTQTEDGMKIKLGVFLPTAAPAEIATGHQQHLLVEFNNALHIAAALHPNLVQREAMKLALKKMKKN